ncbi:orexin receptor type 1-like [Pararge aegeria]|uniref:orexin receptor type 1-like n=1 Tax=Pararge aegeria TaxID=116150 RepID=UPI0019CF91C7|nr:orexin receptor type 1-like [Pararge aegeria]XP_039750907.1 orexin receptor type 1-like [Pararge aegeria]
MYKILSLSICIVINVKYINATRNARTNSVIDNVNNELIIRPTRSLKQDELQIKTMAEIRNYSEEVEKTIKHNVTEDCVGDKQFCNLTKEEYVAMLNDYIYPQTYEWVLIGTHTAVFIVGLVGNTLVCVAVYKNHTMRTVTNYFLVNLAMADFMVLLFCLPATVVWDVTETWFLGDVLCKILLYFQSVSVTVSVLTLTFISVDRWYAICFPLKFKSTINRAKTAIFVIWTVSLLFNTPELVVLTTVKMVPLRFNLEYLVQCTAIWSSTDDLVWHIIKVVFIYTIPLLLMTVAYHQIVRVLWSSQKIPGQAETVKLAPAEQTQLRSRRKAAKMLVAVVIMFAVCYFPVHLLSVLRYVLDMEQNDVITCLALLSHVLCYANSAINPLIYNFMNSKYRREFRRAFCCSTGLRHETSTTLTRLTTSKRKFDQSFEKGQTCAHNVSFKSHNCNHMLQSRGQNCNRMSFTDRRCERMACNGQRCGNTSFNGQNSLNMSYKGQNCGRDGSHNCKCDVNFNNGPRQYERFSPYNQNDYRKNFLS